MVGKKQFDEEYVLERATELFRNRGYASTSIDDVVQFTGVSRSSIYNTYGNKEQLFLLVLNEYCDRMMGILRPDPDLPPRLGIGTFLRNLLDTFVLWGRPGGCLLTNTCNESWVTPLSVQKRTRSALVEQEQQLVEYFTLVQDRGELDPDVDTRRLAHLYVGLRQTISLMWRADMPREKIENTIELSLAALPVPAGQAAATH